MQNYFTIKLSDYYGLGAQEELATVAISQFGATGIEEFNIEEERVDEILGERSYSGADLPPAVIDEVEFTVLGSNTASKIFYFSDKQKAQTFLDFLKSKGLSATLEEKPVQDWDLEWKKSYSPIYISEDLEIVPAWEKDHYSPKSKNALYIYPGMGFGTGNHETTYLCLKLLFETDLNRSKISCMDFGCGSGILGLALRVLVKDSFIDLYDIDPAALENCKQNIAINEIEDEKIRYLLPETRKSFLNKYDVVFANILKNVLEFEAENIVALVDNGGILIVSGLLEGQQEDIIKLYTQKETHLVLKKVLRKNDWVAILFEKQV